MAMNHLRPVYFCCTKKMKSGLRFSEHIWDQKSNYTAVSLLLSIVNQENMNTTTTRSLFLIPATLGESPVSQVIPAGNLEIMHKISHFVVEEEKTARRFLVHCGMKERLDSVRFYLLNEHSQDMDIPAIFIDSGDHDLGLISEAGVPAVADPGAQLVAEAYSRNFRVIPLAGPSSLILALMASGLNGQCFAFNGYLPVKTPERIGRIRFFEKRSETEKQSQIFIETPYRNNQMAETLLLNCKPGTRLCIAANLTLAEEWICTKSIREWKLNPPPDLKGKPSVFILLA
jgi:16S rRNA (cytidine1402-2'-O)-methyltransferase